MGRASKRSVRISPLAGALSRGGLGSAPTASAGSQMGAEGAESPAEAMAIGGQLVVQATGLHELTNAGTPSPHVSTVNCVHTAPQYPLWQSLVQHV